MKYCSYCEKRYADETLVFCLDDGAPLSDRPKPRSREDKPKLIPPADKPKQSSIDTVSFSNPVTAEKIQQTEEMMVNFDKHWDKTQYQKKPKKPVFDKELIQRKVNKSKSSFLLPGVLLALLILGGIGVGTWFYFGSSAESIKSHINSFDEPQNTSPSNLGGISSRISQEKNSPAENVSTSVNKSPDDLKKEIIDNINAWKDAAESRDVTAYVSKYADKVDYYDKTGVSVTEVRNAVQKVFSANSDIDIILSSVNVAVDTDGQKATASFDKEWTYEADKNLSHGKDHIRLQLQKSGSEWKIFSEKVKKNYYTRN